MVKVVTLSFTDLFKSHPFESDILCFVLMLKKINYICI